MPIICTRSTERYNDFSYIKCKKSKQGYDVSAYVNTIPLQRVYCTKNDLLIEKRREINVLLNRRQNFQSKQK